jgi:large subunit ribosomal protein L29
VKPSEIRALSDAELFNELENAEQRQFNLHFQRTTQNLESTAELGKIRKDIARLRTIIAERALERSGTNRPEADQSEASES